MVFAKSHVDNFPALDYDPDIFPPPSGLCTKVSRFSLSAKNEWNSEFHNLWNTVLLKRVNHKSQMTFIWTPSSSFTSCYSYLSIYHPSYHHHSSSALLTTMAISFPSRLWLPRFMAPCHSHIRSQQPLLNIITPLIEGDRCAYALPGTPDVTTLFFNGSSQCSK
jgi:hypothetical protein